MSDIPIANNIGNVQVKLEAASEHINNVWGKLIREGAIPKRGRWNSMPYRNMDWPIDSVAYSLAAVDKYIYACQMGMYEFIGTTDGQLCPYDDCAHDLAIEIEGWCKCAHCQRPFFSRYSDSDYSDYHTRLPKKGEEIPKALLNTRDLGPSWATPDK